MLINCCECGREVSDTASKCPYCGAKVQKEKNKRNNPFKQFTEKATRSVKGKRIYFGSVIVSFVLALSFIVMTCISFFSPTVFLANGYFRDAEELLAEYDNNAYVFISGNYYDITKVKIGNNDRNKGIWVYGKDLTVLFMFYAGGTVEAYTESTDYDIHCTYKIEKSGKEVVDIYYPSIYTYETAMAYFNASIKMAETVIDYVLTLNNRAYNFNSVIDEYCDYHNTILGLRISCTLLAAIFVAVSVGGFVLLIKYGKKQLSHDYTKIKKSKNMDTVVDKAATTKAVVSVEADRAIAESLKLYKDLFDNGIITQDEFEKKKKEILH